MGPFLLISLLLSVVPDNMPDVIESLRTMARSLGCQVPVVTMLRNSPSEPILIEVTCKAHE